MSLYEQNDLWHTSILPCVSIWIARPFVESIERRDERLIVRQRFASDLLLFQFKLVPQFEEQEQAKRLQALRSMKRIVPEEVGDLPEFLTELVEVRRSGHGCPLGAQ